MSNISKYNYSLLSSKYDFKNRDQNILNYIKYMLVRTSAMFKYSNLPPELTTSLIENILQSSGKSLITRINGKIYALRGEGRDRHLSPYDTPIFFHVNNIALGINKSFKIGENCVLMQGDTLEMGLLPMLNKYCTQLADNDITISMCNINSRLQAYISATDETTKQSAEKFLKDLEDGKLGVIAENKIFDSLKVEQVKTSNSYQQLIELQQYIKASMYNELGLSANYNMKRERLSSAEVESNTDNLYPLVDDMLYCREQALLQINEMFNTNITVDFNSSWRLRIDTVGDVRDGKNAEKKETGTGAGQNFIADNMSVADNKEREDAGKKEGGIAYARDAGVTREEDRRNDPELETDKKNQNEYGRSDVSAKADRRFNNDENDDNEAHNATEKKSTIDASDTGDASDASDAIDDKNSDKADDKKVGDNTKDDDVSNRNNDINNQQKSGERKDGDGQDNSTDGEQEKNNDSKGEPKKNKSTKKKSDEKEERK